MSRKDKLSILRTEEFADVEDELSAALEQLESANNRVQALLESEKAPMEGMLPLDAPDGAEDAQIPAAE